jgi:monofunctional biosynthetic peptidoglycan transglycosylase
VPLRRYTIPAYLATLGPKLRRWFEIAVLIGLITPWLLVLPLNFIDPPTTAVMLARATQRAAANKTPAYPRRDLIARAEISPYLRRAVLAAEDDRFYLHYGFDFTEMGNAIERAQRGGRLRGASTITQQVAKNLFLWEGRSFIRKGLEAYFTLVLETCLTKDRILDLYLNLAEWGDGVFGAEMAARTHFSVPARALTAEQAARLAAILPNPRRWSPFGGYASNRAYVIMAVMERPALRP